MKHKKQPQDCFVKEVSGKHFVNLINLSKFLAILYDKQTYNGSHF